MQNSIIFKTVTTIYLNCSPLTEYCERAWPLERFYNHAAVILCLLLCFCIYAVRLCLKIFNNPWRYATSNIIVLCNRLKSWLPWVLRNFLSHKFLGLNILLACSRLWLEMLHSSLIQYAWVEMQPHIFTFHLLCSWFLKFPIFRNILFNFSFIGLINKFIYSFWH